MRIRPGIVPAALTLAACLHARAGTVDLIGFVTVPADAHDLSGLAGKMGDNVPADRLGGWGSAIDWVKGDQYVIMPDRGPSNGDANYPNRFHVIEIGVHPGAAEPVTFKLVSTTMMKRSGGQAFNGASGGYNTQKPLESNRLDPEGVRVGGPDSIWVSDEYGPWIDQFGFDGVHRRRIAPPAKFLIQHPSGDAAEEQATNKSGRQPNRGFEGLAISRDWKTLYALTQSPLLQDGGKDDSGKRQGVNSRLLQVSLVDGTTRELVYVLDAPKHGLNELLAINDHEFLAIERDGDGGEKAKTKHIVKIDIAGATDVSAVEPLPAKGLPAGVKPVAKSLFLDMLDPKYGLAGSKFPEKVEGLAWGPTLEDGRHTLIITSDNDFKSDVPSWIWVFAFDAKELPGLLPREAPASK